MQQSLDELCSLCRAEIQSFRRHEPYDDRFCFEIFRRAILDRDNDCWRELQGLYQDQVIAWCHRAGSSSAHGPDDLAAMAWEKFWVSFGPNHFSQASGTPAIQRYLKTCVYSIIIDMAREQRATISLDRPISQASDESLSLADSLIDITATPEENVVAAASREELKQILDAHTQDERERTVLYLKYELGLSAAEVHTRRPDLFMTVADVYRVTRNLLDRLRRSPEMHKWFNEENVT